MKKIISAIILSMLIICSSALVQAENEPKIINYSKIASPGNIIQILGHDFLDKNNECELLAYVYESNEKATLDMADINVEIVNLQNDVIQAKLPDDLENGVYCLWLKNDNGASEPMFINKAEVFWTSDSSIYGGQEIRIFGRNFLNPATGKADTVKVKIHDNITEEEKEVSVVSVSQYTIDVVVPDDLVEGNNYSFAVTNGLCGDDEYSYSGTGDNAVYCAADDNLKANAAEFGIQKQWLKNVNNSQRYKVEDYGIVGDGVTDNTAAIEALMQKIRAEGGGIVEFGEGTYLVSEIYVPSATIIKGKGKNKTIIKYIDTRKPNDDEERANWVWGESVWFIYSESSYIGFAELKIENTVDRPETDWRRRMFGWLIPVRLGATTAERVGQEEQSDKVGYFFKNVDIYNTDGAGTNISARSDVSFEGCDIHVTHSAIQINTSGEYDKPRSKIVDCKLYNTQRPLINSMYATRMWMEGNYMDGKNCGDDYEPNWEGDPRVEPRIPKLTGDSTNEHRYADLGDRYNYVANNTVTGQFGSQPPFNDGEGFLTQSQERLAYDPVTKATSNTLTDTSKNFSDNRLVNCTIAIIYGKGAGQFRVITKNTGDTFTISEDWDVIPDSTSYYTIDRYCAYQNIFANNNITADTKGPGINLFLKNYDNIIDGNIVHNTYGIAIGGGQNHSQARADYSYFCYVANNDVAGCGYKWPQDTAASSGVIGTSGHHRSSNDYTAPFLQTVGNEYRSNKFSCIGYTVQPSNDHNARAVLTSGIFLSTASEGFLPRTKANIVENNTVTKSMAGLHISKSSVDTVVYSNKFDGNKVKINDTGSIRTTMVPGEYEYKGAVPITLGLTSNAEQSTEEAVVFTDIAGHWAEAKIKEIAKLGVVVGVGDGLFMPDNKVSRAEFVTMALRAIGVPEFEYQNVYSDVLTENWYANVVQAAYNKELFDENLVRNNRFYPERDITREEMTSIILKALEYKNNKKENTDVEANFFDNEQISDWAKGYIGAAVEAGLVEGVSDNMFAPKETATRAQAVTIIFNLIGNALN